MVVDRNRMEARLEQWSNGSMVMAVVVALIIGMVIGAVIF